MDFAAQNTEVTWREDKSNHRVVVNSVLKAIRNCFGFCHPRLPRFSIRCKTTTNRDLTTRVFPRLAPFTCICCNFSLVRCVINVCCDRPVQLLWFWFYDTQQLKTVLNDSNMSSQFYFTVNSAVKNGHAWKQYTICRGAFERCSPLVGSISAALSRPSLFGEEARTHFPSNGW